MLQVGCVHPEDVELQRYSDETHPGREDKRINPGYGSLYSETHPELRPNLPDSIRKVSSSCF